MRPPPRRLPTRPRAARPCHRPHRPPVAATTPDAAAAGWGSSPPPRSKLLWAAAKPPMYLVALVPVAVGGAAAAAATGVWATPTLTRLAAGAVAVVAWLNLSNDAFDAATGVDATKAESVVALTGGRAAPVHAAALACLAAGAALLAAGLSAAADATPARLLAAAIAAGYVYQGPPFRLSYKGLGEPLAFAAFGPAATTAFYLTAAAAAASGAALSPPPPITPTALAAACIVGATTATVLLCSHFHQTAGDAAAGKRSPAVRLGTRRAAAVVGAVVAAVHASIIACGVAGVLPWPAVAAATAAGAPVGAALARRAAADHGRPGAIRTLKLDALKWHGVVGVAVAAGLGWGVG